VTSIPVTMRLRLRKVITTSRQQILRASRIRGCPWCLIGVWEIKRAKMRNNIVVAMRARIRTVNALIQRMGLVIVANAIMVETLTSTVVAMVISNFWIVFYFLISHF